ncbi:MAG: DNA-binding protein [Bacteroidota bacterium]|nr:DNA-binding protein [Bacteroidota bacterium]
MKKQLSILAGILTCMCSYSQTSLKPEEAAGHVGENVTVCGKVFGGKFLETAKDKPTFLNMGAKYPDSPLTIVIWDSLRSKLSYKPEEKFNNKEICITGKIELYRGKPEIILQEAGQIKEQEQ